MAEPCERSFHVIMYFMQVSPALTSSHNRLATWPHRCAAKPSVRAALRGGEQPSGAENARPAAALGKHRMILTGTTSDVFCQPIVQVSEVATERHQREAEYAVR